MVLVSQVYYTRETILSLHTLLHIVLPPFFWFLWAGNRHVASIPCRRGPAANCTHSHVVSVHEDWPVTSPLHVFSHIKAVAHAYCKIRMHHLVKQRNILVTGKMSGKQCQSWFYLDINDNLKYFNIRPRFCVQSVLSSSKTAFYEKTS